MLTQTQIRHYQQNGFLVLEQFFDDSQIQALRQELTQMIDSAPTSSTNRKNRHGQTVEHPSDFSFTLQEPEGEGQVINRISNPLARSEVVLRAYGCPKLCYKRWLHCVVLILCPLLSQLLSRHPTVALPLTGTRTAISRLGYNRSAVSILASIFTPQQ